LTRGVIGGTLMGLANLVPGISGGTMLLAAGVYTYFVEGIAEVTTLKFRLRNLLTLASIGGAAALAIVLLAGLVKGLVVDHRWIMYSLFIGLTLGGVPVVWRLLRPMNTAAVIGCIAGIGVMALMAIAQPGAAGGSGDRAYAMLLFAGIAGASAMILPGVSGGYLLLILGQYIPILSAIDAAKTGLQARDWPIVVEAMHVFIPVGLGVVIGVVGVSNLMKMLLARYRKPTLGVLLGLLLGAVLGLWPFQEGVRPLPGDVIKGSVMTETTLAELDPEDYPLTRFTPSAGQVAGALGLVLAGFAATVGIAKIGGREEEPA
jgi:putative membrane protein